MHYSDACKHFQRFVMPLEHKRKPGSHFPERPPTPSV